MAYGHRRNENSFGRPTLGQRGIEAMALSVIVQFEVEELLFLHTLTHKTSQPSTTASDEHPNTAHAL
jgi:hypothetical protein